MGISGLLPLLKSIHKPCHIRKFKGQTIGVDAYGWLHRGTVSCAIDLALDRPVTKYAYVDFAIHRVRMLLHYGVTPYIVFDGDHLPSKAATELERAKRREDSKRAGLELYRMGKISQAHQELQKAVDVTPYMARLFIEELKKIDVQYIVAPYEADAQLVYLEKKGIISGILSEDSDMLVFGATRLLTKLEQYGDCIEINRNEFGACRDISLIGWTAKDFRRMAILSGCDYLVNIKKMGLKTAYRYVRRYKSIEKVLQMLQFEGQFHVPAGYLEDFKQAELTFLHQRIFCPLSRDMSMLTELDGETKEEDLPFIGAPVDQETAIGVACGDLDPMTKEPIVVRSLAGNYQIRRQTIATDLDLKKVKKPIDSFFQAKRQPLAELDPNSFLPSPTQQRLLENASTSWNSRLSPATNTSRSRMSLPVTRPSPWPTARSSHRDEWLSRAAIIPEQVQPAKRQRLCSDADEPTASDKENSKSKFFLSKETVPSLVDKKERAKKAKKSDINIYSDDSIEEYMAQLPNDFAPIKPPKLTVFSGAEKVEKSDVILSQEDTSQGSTLVSESSVVSNFTADSSVAASFDGVNFLEEVHTFGKVTTSKLAQKFSYGKTNRPALSTVQDQVRAPGPHRRSSNAKDRGSSTKKFKSESKAKISLSRSMNLNHGDDFAPEAHKFAAALGESTTQDAANEVEISEQPRARGVITRTPPPEAVPVGVTVSVPRGSEDLLVPNSEDDEVESTSDDEMLIRPGLQLEEFVYNSR